MPGYGIGAYHRANGQQQRTVCLIPSSAHGTNPPSANMVGMQVVVVASDAQGNVDLADLHAQRLNRWAIVSRLMITYPSTHGVFEESITSICEMIHDAGGQVYMDGANMNAMVGIAQPGKFGSDVSRSEPAQDLLYSSWRRVGRGWPGCGARAPCAFSAGRCVATRHA